MDTLHQAHRRPPFHFARRIGKTCHAVPWIPRSNEGNECEAGGLDIRPIGQLDAYSVYEFRCECHSCMNGQNDWWSDVVIGDS